MTGHVTPVRIRTKALFNSVGWTVSILLEDPTIKNDITDVWNNNQVLGLLRYIIFY